MSSFRCCTKSYPILPYAIDPTHRSVYCVDSILHQSRLHLYGSLVREESFRIGRHGVITMGGYDMPSIGLGRFVGRLQRIDLDNVTRFLNIDLSNTE